MLINLIFNLVDKIKPGKGLKIIEQKPPLNVNLLYLYYLANQTGSQYPFGLIIGQIDPVMKKIAFIFILFLLAFNPFSLVADGFDDIANALRSGDSRAVSRYFGNTVDLTLPNQEDVYSKAQAEQILREFFSKNTPKGFSIIHKGISKEGARYAIGSMPTGQGTTFRVYFFVKQLGSTTVLQELRFMTE